MWLRATETGNHARQALTFLVVRLEHAGVLPPSPRTAERHLHLDLDLLSGVLKSWARSEEKSSSRGIWF